MLFFAPNGTTHFARHSDETRIGTFVCEIFAPTWTRTNKCWLTCLALYSGSCYVNAEVSLCPREKLTHVCRHTLCLGQIHNLFRVIAQTIPYSMLRYAPLLNCLFQPELQSVSLNHGSSSSSMAGTSKIPPFSVSTVAEATGAIDVKSVCPADSVEVRFDRPCTRMCRVHR